MEALQRILTGFGLNEVAEITYNQNRAKGKG
jgi:hypothetical protein